MIFKLIKIYIYTSWLPLAFYVAAYFYLGTLDGWSEWASAKVVVPSFLLSVIYAVVGLFMIRTNLKSIDSIGVFIASILLSSSLMLWFIIRYILLELKMSFS